MAHTPQILSDSPNVGACPHLEKVILPGAYCQLNRGKNIVQHEIKERQTTFLKTGFCRHPTPQPCCIFSQKLRDFSLRQGKGKKYVVYIDNAIDNSNKSLSINCHVVCIVLFFPCGTSGKNLPAKAGDERDTDSIPESGRSPGGGHGNPLQFSFLENPMDRGVWWAMIHKVTKRQTQLKCLSMHECIHTLF